MQKRTLEISVGVLMVLGVLSMLFLALEVSGLQQIMVKPGYHIRATFDNIGNLRVRSRVTISGVQIGKVTDIGLDPHTFRSVVTMEIEPEINNIPRDSSASIHTAGLIGENYIAVLPGADEAPMVLKNDDMIEDTQGALILEKFIQKMFATKLSS